MEDSSARPVSEKRQNVADNKGNGGASDGANGNAGNRADEGSIKETVEAILVAFILAFIFRGFVVEAFVIPTGSMAPTLLGAHMRFVCDDCGYQFEMNFSAPGARDDDLKIPDEAGAKPDRTVVCPNCGYMLPASEPRTPAYNPLVRYGDRILVLKYLYLFKDPNRWDVVVFKS